MSKNGAGFDPLIEDVWPYDDDYTSHPKPQFITHFVTYARNKEMNKVLETGAEEYYNHEIILP